MGYPHALNVRCRASEAGRCRVRGCGRPAQPGTLQCERCRAGLVPGHGAAPEKPERVIRLEIKRFYRLRYGALVIDTEQGYRSPRCRQCGAWNGQGGTRVDRGMPDLVVLTDHGVRFVEVKSRKGRQRPEQRAFQEACERAGVPYILARSLEDVVRFEESTWSTSRNAWASGSSPMAKTPGAAK